ncbi:hypothetical protein B0H14DRAFT_3132063 [Mycena olivaceomarginata]|nr:hypothetical protein B0H14DRAFT_3132063 [Mycena olivaceomarginata]
MLTTAKKAGFVCQLSEGVFMNPDTQGLEEVVAKPRSAATSGPCQPIASALPSFGQDVPVFVSNSGQGHTNAMEYTIERRELSLDNDVEVNGASSWEFGENPTCIPDCAHQTEGPLIRLGHV